MRNEEPPDCSDLDPIEGGLPEGVREYKGDPARRKKAGRMLCIASVGTAAVLFVLILIFIMVVKVEGNSMYPSLRGGDRLLVEKASYLFGNPRRFDVVVFRPFEEEKDTFYVKRIIGLPGETVWIHDAAVYIDGKPLDSRYGSGLSAGRAERPVRLEKDEYFVIGDNYIYSRDSRSDEVGSVARHSILGRAFYRVGPGGGAWIRHR